MIIKNLSEKLCYWLRKKFMQNDTFSWKNVRYKKISHSFLKTQNIWLVEAIDSWFFDIIYSGMLIFKINS